MSRASPAVGASWTTPPRAVKARVKRSRADAGSSRIRSFAATRLAFAAPNVVVLALPRSSRDHATAIAPVSATANRPSATWSPAPGGCSRRTVAASGALDTAAPAAVALRMKCSRRPLMSPSLGRDGRSQPPGAHELDEFGDQRVVPLLAGALLAPAP